MAILFDRLIIDEALASKYFPNTNPIGQRIYYRENQSGTVVGVVSTLKDFTELAPTRGVLYQLVSQWYFHKMEIVIKAEGEPMRLADALRAQVRALDKDQTCELKTLESTLAHMLGPRRFSMVLLSVYAGIALLIACVGLYGLLQYSTAQHTHAIGIRMALGARDVDILKATLGQGLKIIFIGVLIGLFGAATLSKVLSSLLYDVTPTDPLILACASFVLVIIALYDSDWIPEGIAK